MNTIEKHGERCLEALSVWAPRVALLLLVLLVGVQAGISAGRQMEREARLEVEGIRSSQPPHGLQRPATGYQGAAQPVPAI